MSRPSTPLSALASLRTGLGAALCAPAQAQSLLELVKREKVTVDAALSASSNPHDFTLQLQQARVPLPS